MYTMQLYSTVHKLRNVALNEHTLWLNIFLIISMHQMNEINHLLIHIQIYHTLAILSMISKD